MAWNIDNTHSSIGFTVRHMVFAKVHGRFDKWTAKLELDDANINAGKVTVEIDAASINTNEEKRDGHLKSADFLDVAKNPTIKFVSKRVETKGDHLHLIGDLTINGTTKEVSLETEKSGSGKDPWGNARIAFSAKTSINRKDFGLSWNQALEAGGVLVGEKVDIEIDIQAVKS
jgi:polyisoprenoid-binding protein YceI